MLRIAFKGQPFARVPSTYFQIHAQPANVIRCALNTSARDTSKLWENADKAVADVKSGSTILSAGFGLCGTAG